MRLTTPCERRAPHNNDEVPPKRPPFVPDGAPSRTVYSSCSGRRVVALATIGGSLGPRVQLGAELIRLKSHDRPLTGTAEVYRKSFMPGGRRSAPVGTWRLILRISTMRGVTDGARPLAVAAYPQNQQKLGPLGVFGALAVGPQFSSAFLAPWRLAPQSSSAPSASLRLILRIRPTAALGPAYVPPLRVAVR
jgi:hypothetical protein